MPKMVRRSILLLGKAANAIGLLVIRSSRMISLVWIGQSQSHRDVLRR